MTEVTWSIPVAGYRFKGPLEYTKDLLERKGVFLVVCRVAGKYYLIDVDHADNIKKSILYHERQHYWREYKRGKLMYAVLYLEDSKPGYIQKVEAEIRNIYKSIPCKP
jgi:hypothetical protein